MSLDLLLRHAQIVDVFRLRTFHGWAAVRDGRFVYVEEGDPPADLSARDERGLQGRFLAPGLIDAHMHIESSLTTPRRFAQAAVPHGTTTVLADPHEVANVAGEAGVRWMIRASQGLPLRVFYAIPSCVPATDPSLEWTAPVFEAGVVTRLAQEPSVIALGEVMDYQGLRQGNARLKELVEAAHAAGLFVEGHIPTLRGTELSDYLAHRITSDHTLTTPAKIAEQISKGLAVMLQAKSCTPGNMAAVAVLADRSRILLITDDIEPSLLARGHLTLIMDLALKAGMPALEVWASATIRPARYIGRRDLGGIAPGFHADFCILDALDRFPPAEVWSAGELVARSGRFLLDRLPDPVPPPTALAAPGPFRPADFCLVHDGATATETIANAVVIENAMTSVTSLAQVCVPLQDGYAHLSRGDDLALVAVVARNGSSRSVGILKGFGLERGAIASTVAHDSHNLLVVGRDAHLMSEAANRLHELGGGVIALGESGEQLAVMPLPILGLLSDERVETITQQFEALEASLRELGVRSQRPFLMLSLLALSVSPHYKFTDKGIIDTEARQLLSPALP